jgi:hypothetical protein
MEFGKTKKKQRRRRDKRLHYLVTPKGVMLKKQMVKRRAKNKTARASRKKNRHG